jgi:hypothetical protein
MAEDADFENIVAATVANGIMAAKGGTPTPIEAVAHASSLVRSLISISDQCSPEFASMIVGD